LKAELEWRQSSGEQPDLTEYLERFPDLAEVVSSVFDSVLVEPTVLVVSDPLAETHLRPREDGAALAQDEQSTGSGAAPAPDGKEFGDYVLLGEIARGGMGVVLRAHQKSLNRDVALKMILARHLASEEDIRRFQTEAESAVQLDHPGIVPIYEVGEIDGQHYFSMALVEGVSLAAKLRADPLPPREAAQLLQQIVQAVGYAHERSIIHRDLKPANILLTKDGAPRITDFGLAKQTTEDSGLTASGQVMGTPSYMPPEQAAGTGGRNRRPAEWKM